MPASIKEKVLSGLAWRAMERFGTQAINFVLTIVLARLLEPKDFGTIALLSVFLLLANVFVNSGFGTAIIQKKEVDERDLNSVFYLSLVISTVLYGILFFVAPFIARFYEEPLLIPVLRWMALGLIFSAINGVQHAILTREMRFQASFCIQLSGCAVHGLVGIGLAYKGYGIWSLVFASLASRITSVIGCWLLIGWRPRLLFCWTAVRQLFSFSSKILASTLLETLFNNLYNLIIGKLYNPVILGYYNRGQSLPMTIMSSINSTISGVMLPALSHAQDDKEQMRRMARRVILTSTFLVFPAMIGLAAVAHPLVRVLLTDKWLPCVPYLQLSCITYAFWPLHEANLQVIMASGRSDIFLKLELIKKTLIIAVILITFRHGVLSMVIGQAILSPLCVFVNAWPSRTLIHYTIFEQVIDILPVLIIAIVMGLIIFWLPLTSLSLIWLLIVKTAVGTILYFVTCWVFKIEPYNYFSRILVDVVNKQVALKKT